MYRQMSRCVIVKLKKDIENLYRYFSNTIFWWNAGLCKSNSLSLSLFSLSLSLSLSLYLSIYLSIYLSLDLI